jgi:hypothetical protein
MHKLLDLLANQDGVTMIHANDINNSGLIVGYTNRGAFIAVPTGD